MEQIAIPGIDLEPLEPFYDDVFAGMDEHPAGPWPHHVLDPAELHMHQVSTDTHFPAIDCDLLEGQPEVDSPTVSCQQQDQDSCAGEQSLNLAASAPSVSPAPAGHAPALHVAPPGVNALERPLNTVQPPTAAADPNCRCNDVDGAQPSATDVNTYVSTSTSSTLEFGIGALPQLQQLSGKQLAEGNADAQAMSSASFQPQVSSMAQPSPGSSSCCRPLQDELYAASTEHGGLLAIAAAAAAATNTGGDAVCSDEAFCHTAASAEAVAEANVSATPPCCTASYSNVGDGKGISPANASSGSLPDIDDVSDDEPDSQAGAEQQQQQQQQEEKEQEHEQEPQLQVSPTVHTAVVGSSMALNESGDSSRADSSSAGPACAEAGGRLGNQDASGQAAPFSTPQVLPVPGAPATGMETVGQAGCTAADHSDAPESSSTGAAGEGMPAATAGSGDQQLSADADDFASPCSSWHSCITSGSKASQGMTSSRGFFLQAPAAAAVISTAAQQQSPRNSVCDDVDQQQLLHQEQLPSKSGTSTPAMVSSLHMALQQQQQQSHHSDAVAEPGALPDPLTSAAVATSDSEPNSMVHPLQDITPAIAPDASALPDAAGADSSGNVDGPASSSQPIAMVRSGHQEQQQHAGRPDEELWQSVSPPSFSSSPGLLVSAAAARAAAQHYQQQQQHRQQQVAEPDATAAAAGADEQHEFVNPLEDDDDDVGHGRFYAQASGLSMSPEEALQHQLHAGLLQRPGLQQQQHQHMSNSSYVLRQSELVDLSLSTSLHPSQLQHMQQQHCHPGWLAAHQQLPPAAAQAVERAAVALNDSYCYQGRANSPSEVLGAAAAAASATSGGGRGMGGAVAIRRSGAGPHWNKAHTQPQQDQHARHRLPSAAHNGPVGFGWPGAAVLGDWFSSTVQQPLVAAASRAAVGVGQRLGMAPGQNHLQQQQGMTGRNNSSSRVSAAAAPAYGASSSGARSRGGSTCSNSSAAGLTSTEAADVDSAAAAGEGLEDAVLIEKTSDLPQSMQEQEDEAFRGLLFLGGRDSQGRPVVIVNTDAIPAGHNSAPRDAAMAYLLKRLGPIVMRGPYVLVIVALHNGSAFRLLPGVWCVRAYQSLPRAFRKHVKHVILLQPSMLVKTAVTLLYPFVSSKAHAKVKQVQRLLDIDAATCGEVQVPHLGEAFLTTLHHINTSRTIEREGNTQD